jgi:hypothetical protein
MDRQRSRNVCTKKSDACMLDYLNACMLNAVIGTIKILIHGLQPACVPGKPSITSLNTAPQRISPATISHTDFVPQNAPPPQLQARTNIVMAANIEKRRPLSRRPQENTRNHTAQHEGEVRTTTTATFTGLRTCVPQCAHSAYPQQVLQTCCTSWQRQTRPPNTPKPQQTRRKNAWVNWVPFSKVDCRNFIFFRIRESAEACNQR